jgi:crystallin, alpha B
MDMIAAINPMMIRMMDHFGQAINPDDLLNRMPINRSIMTPTGYNRNWMIIPRNDQIILDENAKTKMMTAKDGSFQVCIDVHHFQPKEIHIKTIAHTIIVEGKHEERTDDHGFIERKFTRKYQLPSNYDIEHVISSISSDGILTIKAPPPSVMIEGKKQRIIPIMHTGPAHLNVKEPHMKIAEGKK